MQKPVISKAALEMILARMQGYTKPIDADVLEKIGEATGSDGSEVGNEAAEFLFALADILDS